MSRDYHHPMNIGESNVNLSCPEHKYLNVVTNETSDSSVWGQPWYSSSNGSSRIHGYSHSQRIAINLGIFAFLVNRIFRNVEFWQFLKLTFVILILSTLPCDFTVLLQIINMRKTKIGNHEKDLNNAIYIFHTNISG